MKETSKLLVVFPNSQNTEVAKRNPIAKVIVRPSHEISWLIFFRDRDNFFIADF
jgi:hypothetical protein